MMEFLMIIMIGLSGCEMKYEIRVHPGTVSLFNENQGIK